MTSKSLYPGVSFVKNGLVIPGVKQREYQEFFSGQRMPVADGTAHII